MLFLALLSIIFVLKRDCMTCISNPGNYLVRALETTNNANISCTCTSDKSYEILNFNSWEKE